jgi:hypothetical protein
LARGFLFEIITKGLLIPRTTEAKIPGKASTASGLIVCKTNAKAVYFSKVVHETFRRRPPDWF